MFLTSVNTFSGKKMSVVPESTMLWSLLNWREDGEDGRVMDRGRERGSGGGSGGGSEGVRKESRGHQRQRKRKEEGEM